MGDRAPVHITIGGALPREHLEAFAAYAADYDLRTEWDGAPFDPAVLPEDEPLELYGTELNGGQIPEIDAFLGCPTPDAWIEAALADQETLLIDHKNCEFKAASTALSLIAKYNTHLDLINMMSRLEHVEEEKENYDFFLNLPEIDRSKLERIDIRTSQLITPLFLHFFRNLIFHFCCRCIFFR